MAITLYKPRTQVSPWTRWTDWENDLGNFWAPLLRSRDDAGDLRTWSPALDVHETEDAYVVEAEVPGLDKKDIEITVLEDLLTIKGERKRDDEVKEASYHRIERSYGSFQRSISLPNSVDSGKVTARFKNGVLHITLPKREEAKPREIQVEVDG